MWIMGVSMALSFSNKDAQSITYDSIRNGRHTFLQQTFSVEYIKQALGCGDSQRQRSSESAADKYRRMWYLSTVRRSLILFGLGMFLANGYEYTTWRVPGVLQYFAMSNFITTFTVLVCLPKTNEEITRIKFIEGTSDRKSVV